MKKRHFDWSGKRLGVSRLASGARIVKSHDGEPQNEDRLTFYDPYDEQNLTGTVRSAAGYFDAEADGILYQYTIDVDKQKQTDEYDAPA